MYLCTFAKAYFLVTELLVTESGDLIFSSAELSTIIYLHVHGLFLCWSSAMEAKFHLCLLMILLGTITVLGARPGYQQEDTVDDYKREPRKCW